MKKNIIPQKINNIIDKSTRYIEILISIVIMVVILILIADLIYDITQISLFHTDTEYFTDFLSQALSLVVGIEFVKMLCKHTPETVVEVLMFATARQMVVEHLQTWQTLIGIIGIAILFAVRKYLFLTSEESSRLADKF